MHLHLPLAARAHALGIPVLYYIAPQLWAWGSYRIHKLRNQVDRVAVVLPFEEKYLRDQGVNTLTPANLGPFQWACIVALSFFGIARAEALGVSLVLQGVRFGSIGFLAAALWLERLVFGRQEAAQAAG